MKKTGDPSNKRVTSFGFSSVHVLFKRSNRGRLMDIVVFIINLVLMQQLTSLFVGMIKAAEDGSDPLAGPMLFVFCLSLAVLPPAGATLKRWHLHQRLKDRSLADPFSMPAGCLFNPIFYFCLTAVIFSAVNAFILQFMIGNRDPGAAVFISMLTVGIALMVTHTVLVYRYFSPPKRPPRSAFMRDPRSELLGDVMLFVNVLNFQLIWNLLSFAGLPRPTGPFDVLGRIIVLCFLALLLYFPPRVFYLVEDIKKPLTWFTILLANSPVIFRLVIGTDDDAQW